jgi:hypothetical protein
MAVFIGSKYNPGYTGVKDALAGAHSGSIDPASPATQDAFAAGIDTGIGHT